MNQGWLIGGMSDIVIHDCFGVVQELDWNVIEGDLPSVRQTVEDPLESLKGSF
ncbi:MAG: hypothetical protein Kow0074_17890 [Candidatus Zixiibacteriota bacterium]